MKVLILSTALTVLVLASAVSARAELQEGPIGFDSVELSALRDVFQAPAISEWFQRLSDPSKRILTDVSTSFVILWPDGRLQYRAGTSLAGNKFHVNSDVVTREDYLLLVESLAEGALTAVIDAKRAIVRQREATNVFATSYSTIIDTPDPIKRQSYLALLGELQTELGEETLRELWIINPSAISEPMNALSQFDVQKLNNIRERRFDETGLTGLEDWDNAIRDGLEGLKQDPTSLEFPVELEPGLQGFLRLSPNNSLQNSDVDELVSQGQLELFIGTAASPEVSRIQPTDLNQVIQRVQSIPERGIE